MATRQISIKTKALEMLARREYSRAELEQKILTWLKKKEMKPVIFEDVFSNSLEVSPKAALEEQTQELQKILDEFESKGWISDKRVIESLMNQKARRMGALRLKQELQAKGVDAGLMQETLSSLKSTEFQRACNVWQRKFKTLPDDPKSYAKQMRFITYRGFSAEIARKVLAGGYLESGDDNLHAE